MPEPLLQKIRYLPLTRLTKHASHHDHLHDTHPQLLHLSAGECTRCLRNVHLRSLLRKFSKLSRDKAPDRRQHIRRITRRH